MVNERRGINLSGRIIGPTRVPIASWTTPERKLLPLALSLQVPAEGAFNVAPPGHLARARVTWGHEDADQWAEFDLGTCTVVKLASSISLELYLYPHLRSLYLANTFPVPQPLTQGCSVLIGVAPGNLQSSQGIVLTDYINDVVGEAYLSRIPPWARTVSVWEARGIGTAVTAVPTYYGGIHILRADATLARGFYEIPIQECFRKFFPMGPAGSAGNYVSWTGEMQASGASEMQACFGIEV